MGPRRIARVASLSNRGKMAELGVSSDVLDILGGRQYQTTMRIAWSKVSAFGFVQSTVIGLDGFKFSPASNSGSHEATVGRVSVHKYGPKPHGCL
jgi:hypothetical protein